ncbi:profilin-1A-like [Mya arenaria]|nr:profilin-1A-like [Mya arenaria]
MMMMMMMKMRKIEPILEVKKPEEEIIMPSSWNEYISLVLTDSGFVTNSAIYGTEGRKWASTPGYGVTCDEIKTLVFGFIDPSKLWKDGVRVGGRTFTCTRAESGLIVGRESTEGTGCVVFRCNKCLVIATHEEGAHPGGCYNVVTKLGEYLKEQGI